MQSAKDMLAESPCDSYVITVITDGNSNAGVNVCEVAARLKSSKWNAFIHFHFQLICYTVYFVRSSGFSSRPKDFPAMQILKKKHCKEICILLSYLQLKISVKFFQANVAITL